MDPFPGVAGVNLGLKITLCVCGVVLAILLVGNWLIWPHLPTKHLRQDHVLLGVWTMGGVAFVVWCVVRRLTRPLAELTEIAERRGAGEMGAHFRQDRTDEIGRLARALDDMSRSLDEARQKLEREVVSQSRELESSQAQLLQAARMAAVGELAAGVAHEINNPAGTILMRASSLGSTLHEAAPDVQEDVQVIQRQVEKIRRIVTALLTFAQRADATGERVGVQLNELIVRTAQLMDGLLRERRIEVVLDLEDELPTVLAESARIEQVLLNLVNNAIDAMPQGGRMTFASKRSGARVAVSVADTGSGIDPKILDRIFDPFYTTKDPGQGTGLGLTVSFAIVEQHGGVIEADSVPGEGSRFTLLLPIPDAGPDPVRPNLEAPDVE